VTKYLSRMERNTKKKRLPVESPLLSFYPILWKVLCTLMKIFVHRQYQFPEANWYQFPEANSFLRAKLKENHELWGAHNAKDIYPYLVLKSKHGAIVFIILSKIYYATRWILWKWGILLIFCPVLPGAFSVTWCV